MSTDKVIFVGEQWGATGSHMTERDVNGSHMTGRDHVRNRKYVMRMRNWKICNTPSGTFSPEVMSVTGSDRVRMHNRYILYASTRVVVQVHGCKGWKLRNCPPSGAFSSEVGYRKSQMNEMCDIFIMCFIWFLFVTCLGGISTLSW